MLINQDIKNFVQGISQQPPTLRNPEQLHEQVNGLSTEASGLQKRPPTVLAGKLLERKQLANTPLVHFINRDDREKYVVILDGERIRVYDLDGKEYTVKQSEQDLKYLQTDSPKRNLQCLTIADHTFILNKNVTVKKKPTPMADKWETQGALIHIKSGQYGREYVVKLNKNDTVVAKYTTPDGSEQWMTAGISTDYIANKLAEDAEKNGWHIKEKGPSWFVIDYETQYPDRPPYAVEVFDGFNNQGAFGFITTSQKFNTLPATAPDGYTLRIAGDKGSSSDDYYVTFTTKGNVWKESVRPGIDTGLVNSTMPHVLVREADGTFTLKEAPWAERIIGDDNSNPYPSFVGGRISSMFFYRNRLGFLSGENVILSRSADFFNYWMSSSIDVQDTDPIDLAVSDNKIATLYHAVPFDTELIVFSKDAQFSLRAEGVLTPKDAVLTPALTHYGCSSKATPANAGRSIYFVAERSQYSTVREFFTAADNTDSKDVQDISSHIPSYIRNGVYKIIPSNTENLMLFLTEGNYECIYVYKYLFTDGVRQQASWSRWDMGAKVYGGAFIDGALYLVMERNGYLCLEKMTFTYNIQDFPNEPYKVLLDSKICIRGDKSTYDELTNTSTINVADIYGDLYAPHFVEYKAVTDEGVLLPVKDGKVIIEGRLGVQDYVFVGIVYRFIIRLSTFYVRQTSPEGTTALLDGRLQLRHAWLNYADSGYFKVTVEVFDKDNYDYINTQRLLGTERARTDVLPFTTDKFKFPIFSLNTNCAIYVSSTSPTPISLLGAGWVGNYVRRTSPF